MGRTDYAEGSSEPFDYSVRFPNDHSHEQPPRGLIDHDAPHEWCEPLQHARCTAEKEVRGRGGGGGEEDTKEGEEEGGNPELQIPRPEGGRIGSQRGSWTCGRFWCFFLRSGSMTNGRRRRRGR